MKKNILFEENVTCDLPIEKVWDLVADTNQLNEYIGLFPVQFSPFIDDGNALIRHSEAKALGLITTAWKENVFEWVKYQRYTIERNYTKGPVSRALWSIILEPMGDSSTVVHLQGEFTVSNPLGNLALKHVILPQLRKTFNYVGDYKKNEEQRPLSPKMQKAIQVNESRLATLAAKINDNFHESNMIEALIETLLTCSDDEVNGIKPYAWAERYRFDRQATVELFLSATKVGILDQEWSLMCPNCRVPKGRTNSLKSLERSVHCDLCGIDFEMDFDRYIEMRFTVNASIRKTQNITFCVNGPMNSPHVLAQFRIPAHSQKEVLVPDWKQPIRWRVLKCNDSVEVDASHFEQTASISLSDEGFRELTVSSAQIVHFKNGTSKEVVLVIEEVEWDQFALTARDVTSMQLFRDLFATEVLSSDQQIGIGNLTLLFTDLKSSTQLYATIGDAPAYSNVKKHFDYLMEIISINNGAIVKTIGDSVMAVFTEEVSALKASLHIQRNIDVLNSELTQPLQVKIGFHSGSVIAVNANEILDYFGGTVNMAARIQQESVGDDIVITEEVYLDLLAQPEVEELLVSMKIDHFKTMLYGLEDEIPLVRIDAKNSGFNNKLKIVGRSRQLK